MKPNKYLLLLATVAAYVFFEYYRPKPIDWQPTFSRRDKIPFGTKALYELLPGVMHQATLPALRVPAYTHLTEGKQPRQSNYIFICQDFNASKYDLRELFRYVRRGNNVFIAAYNLPDSLGRMLGFTADLKAPKLRDTTLTTNFTNPRLRRPGGYNFLHDDGRNFLKLKNSAQITVLGRNARQEPIFIKVAFGKGFFFIHNLPLAFTNYYVVGTKTSDYAFRTLSYLPAWPTYWDDYQTLGRFDEDQQSIFRYIQTQPALTWAYYLVVVGLVVYVLFAGKRTQRIIPVVEPPKNTSLEFTKAVGQVYFQQGDHDDLARKKIQYFLAHLRDRYQLSTTGLDNTFTDMLAQKSGLLLAEARALTQLIRAAQRSTLLSEYELLSLNEAIEQFYQTVNA